MKLADSYYTVPQSSKSMGKSRQTICDWAKEDLIETERVSHILLVKKIALTALSTISNMAVISQRITGEARL